MKYGMDGVVLALEMLQAISVSWLYIVLVDKKAGGVGKRPILTGPDTSREHAQ